MSIKPEMSGGYRRDRAAGKTAAVVSGQGKRDARPVAAKGRPAKGASRRKKPVDVRRAALDAGRRLLTGGGPGALTLKAVAAELGMSHPNLIHHFGSAEAFQIELKRTMVADLTRTVTELVRQAGGGGVPSAQAVVDMVFSAYGAGGIGTMLAWSALTRKDGSGDAVMEALAELVAALTPVLQARGVADPGDKARALVRMVTSMALADSLIGRGLSQALGGTPDATRALTVKLAAQLARPQPDGSNDHPGDAKRGEAKALTGP